MSFIIYEQPFNEHVRVCLRLEHLFMQLQYWMAGAHYLDSRSALAALVEILNVLDRPDLKTKLVKELHRYSMQLRRYAETPQIDKTRLQAILHDLETTANHLHDMQGRIAQNLRDNDFLMSMRQHITNPGGGCSFDVSAYYCWIHRPSAERIAQLTQWLGSLKLIQASVDISLRLIRQSSSPQWRVANAGFFQASLSANLSCQLVRIALPDNAPVYPETSVGRHGVSLRFCQLNLLERSVQVSEDINFQLTVCVF